METALIEALRSLKDSRAELQDIQNEFKVWRKDNPNDQIKSGLGYFLHQELSEARKREQTSQKTLQLLFKNMKSFQMLSCKENLNGEGKRKRDVERDVDVVPIEEAKIKKLKPLYESDLHVEKEKMQEESDLQVESIQEKIHEESDSSSSSESEAGSASASSDDSSSSSESNSSNASCSDSNTDTSSEESSSDIKKEKTEVKPQQVKIPGNLSKSKLKTVRKMVGMPSLHHYFDEDQPEILESKIIPKYSETYLYNPKNVSSKKKNKNQVLLNHQNQSGEKQNFNDNETSSINYGSLKDYTDKIPPCEGTMIVFNVKQDFKSY